MGITPIDTRPAPAAGGRPAHEVLAWSNELVQPALRQAAERLAPPVRHIVGYHFGWWEADGSVAAGSGGKGIRPALTLVCAEAVGGLAAAAVPAAAAVELVHNFSLLHDDVMDGDESRRHRPTAWRVFGLGRAILAGDALVALAVDVLTRAASDGGAAGELVPVLCASVQALVEGQVADISFERRNDVCLSECVAMARNKTAALLRAACSLGAAAAGASRAQVRHLADFGADLGLAFQVADDLQGIWGDPRITGKADYSDLRNRKKSLPVVVALESPGAAGRELREWFAGSEEPTAADVARVAALVEAGGGRAWALDQLDGLCGRALSHLAGAEATTQAAADLAGLSGLVHAAGLAAAG